MARLLAPIPAVPRRARTYQTGPPRSNPAPPGLRGAAEVAPGHPAEAGAGDARAESSKSSIKEIRRFSRRSLSSPTRMATMESSKSFTEAADADGRDRPLPQDAAGGRRPGHRREHAEAV